MPERKGAILPNIATSDYSLFNEVGTSHRFRRNKTRSKTQLSFINRFLTLMSCATLPALVFWAATASAGEPLRIVIPPLERSAQTHIAYFPKLLELALTKTEATDGAFTLEYYPQLFTNARFLAELKRGSSVNVMWTMTNAEREQELLAVPISLLQGLNSHRVFLIRKEDREKFARIHSLADLRLFKAGQGAQWPDVAVLQHNDLPVVTSAHYELLFTMLAGKRFDYFPRGLYEVWEEQKIHQDKNLVIEQSLMLYYPAPIYFFVNREQPQLADRISRGLTLAIEDGSFNELFFSTPGFKKGHAEISSKKRRVLDLEPVHMPTGDLELPL